MFFVALEIFSVIESPLVGNDVGVWRLFYEGIDKLLLLLSRTCFGASLFDEVVHFSDEGVVIVGGDFVIGNVGRVEVLGVGGERRLVLGNRFGSCGRLRRYVLLGLFSGAKAHLLLNYLS